MAEFHLLLNRIKFKENVGAIYRLAFQFDIKKIYLRNCAEPGRTNTYKTERHIEIEHVPDLKFLKEYAGGKIAFETSGDPVWPWITPKYEQNVLVAFGNESRGFSKEELKYFDNIISLEAPCQASFNVSHAAAIALYMLM